MKFVSRAAALCAVAAMGLAGSAPAAIYSFSFIGNNASAYGDVVVSGHFTTASPITPLGGPVAITAISGEVSGGSSSVVDGPIGGLSPYAAADNLLYASGLNTGDFYSFGGVSFSVQNGPNLADYNLFGWNGVTNLLVSTIDAVGYPQNGTPAAPPSGGAPITSSVTSVPEPTIWAMLFLGLCGLGAAIRAATLRAGPEPQAPRRA